MRRLGWKALVQLLLLGEGAAHAAGYSLLCEDASGARILWKQTIEVAGVEYAYVSRSLEAYHFTATPEERGDPTKVVVAELVTRHRRRARSFRDACGHRGTVERWSGVLTVRSYVDGSEIWSGRVGCELRTVEGHCA